MTEKNLRSIGQDFWGSPAAPKKEPKCPVTEESISAKPDTPAATSSEKADKPEQEIPEKENIDDLKKELDASHIRYCYLDGSTKDRLGECKRFNLTPEIPVFLISLMAGGTGLNLTGADMVMHYDPWWNPAVEDQATDRAHRIGQKKTVYVMKMIAAGSIEEKVLALQRRKQAVISATVDTTDAAVMESLSAKDLEELLS
jgi:hypothetical protein